MKKLIICLLGLTLLVNHSFSQPERQWMIWNGLGKDGVTPAGNNNYVSGITTEFTLHGIASPNITATNPNARNDIFMIYADGENYNSMPDANPGPFYTSPADYPSVTSHNIKTNRGVGVKYMYLTNRYETDDLPGTVRAMAGVTPGVPNTYTVGSTRSLISVNHSIAIGKDITVIVNYDSINTPPGGTIALRFDGVRPIGGSVVTSGVNIFDLKPVFGSNWTDRKEAVFPIATVDPGTSEFITLQSNPPANGRYRYINLRSNQNIYAFAPLEKDIPRYEAVFTPTKGGVTYGQPYYSPIGLAHDPNYLAVESICQQSDGSYVITYHLEFENDGTGDATRLKAEVEFQPYFDLSCVNAFKWHAAGTLCHGTVAVVGNKATFSFLGHGLLRSKFVNHQESSGYVEFKVIVNSGNDVSDLNVILELINPTVYFDALHFPLNEFRDLIKCEVSSTDSIPGQNSNVSKPTSKKQNPKEKEQTKGKEEEKYVKQDTSGKGKESEQLQESSMSPMGLNINCYRPITGGECVCNPPFCWVCVWAGIAVVLLAGFIVYRIMKKRRNPRPPLGK